MNIIGGEKTVNCGKVFMPVIIESLTLKNIDKYIDGLLQLDAKISDELGRVFGNDPWNAANFSKDLKRKWEFSRMALVKSDEKLCGFIISSEQLPREIHIHRFAVHSQCRNMGIGNALITEIDAIVRQQGFKRITVEVNCHNERTIAFYKKHGYERMSGSELSSYAEKRKSNVLIFNEHIREHDGSEFYILQKRHNSFV